MQIRGRIGNRAVLIEVDSNEASMRLVDVESGRPMDSRSRGATAAVYLAGNTVVWDGLEVALDPGEDLAAGQVLRRTDMPKRYGSTTSTVPEHLPGDALPPVGFWEYEVVRITEGGGFATAEGTTWKMADALNSMASKGWELVTTSNRDNRWIKGESVFLTFRRLVVTEAQFKARFLAEERLRREVLRGLDG